MEQRYCISPYQYYRLPTHEVRIGEVALGGGNPIRVQSMTTTNTMDTAATVAQTLRMVASGAEYVRITAPSKKEAENLQNIKAELRKQGCTVPLIADIHYTPNAAEVAARIVEKVRINPGNYVDKKRFQHIEYSEAEYQAELERIHHRFAPLVKICKAYGTAMRIGTNHGSLSDRIMSRYGDTPLGMVESAMEFLRICETYNYDQVVLSMKASNPQVMVQAYRLLVNKMLERGKVYPLHLGVTEAGEGNAGRIKSAQGIGALLMDGIGDTVRVSLTEAPEYESPVAQFLIDMFTREKRSSPPELPDFPRLPINPYAFERRKSDALQNLGENQVPRIIVDCSTEVLTHATLENLGYRYNEIVDKYSIDEMAVDYLYLGKKLPAVSLPGALYKIYDHDFWGQLRAKESSFPFYASPAVYLEAASRHPALNFIQVSSLREAEEIPTDLNNICLILNAEDPFAAHHWRKLLFETKLKNTRHPIILKLQSDPPLHFYEDAHLQKEYRLTTTAQKQLFWAAQTGSMVVDGLLDGFWATEANQNAKASCFGILQAGRLRITQTEYISCPSCGRTLFDLQETTARIRKRTEHLKGVKIGIMGCIVNGPGEMADADYGYVGVGPGKIALYRGKEVVEKAVKTEEAVDKLIELIRIDGNWVEPQY